MGARVGEYCACTAMMQEIASKDGNFCGVCPVIGRLNCFCKRLRISLRREKVGLGRPFFMGLSDTHGGADRNNSTVPRHYAN